MGKSLKLIIEALLFASDAPLNIKDIQNCLPDESTSNIDQALKELLHDYETEERSFTLKQVAKGYQFRTKSEYATYVLQMLKTKPTRLSGAAMETLAIIAYKQPILRHEIERLRGVDVGGILRTLLEKDLIRIMSRKSLPGKPLIYGTTRKFLEVFDLRDLNSLPKLKEIRELTADEEKGSQVPESPASMEPSKENREKREEENPGEPDADTSDVPQNQEPGSSGTSET